VVQLNLERIDELLKRFDKQLKDPSLKQKLVDTEFDKPIPIKFEGATFTLDGNASIEVFNSPDDTDTDQVVGTKPQNDDADEFDVGPQVVFDPAHAWLKYRAQATVKASARRNLARLGFSFDGETGVVLSSYRIHAPDEKLPQAVLDDLGVPLTILSVDDLRALKVGEAVSMRLHGRLDGSVTLEWTDVFSGSMSFLGALLGAQQVFGIKIGADLSTKVDVHVRDDFVITFSRFDNRQLRIAVHKAKNRSVTSKLSASIGVKFADADDVSKVLNQVYHGLAGDTIARVDKLLSKTSLDRMTESEQEAVERLAERFGIDDELEDLRKLREAWNELKEKAKKAIKRMAEAKAKIGFTYEYSRLRESTAVLQARVDRSKIGDYHSPLVKGDLRPLLDDLHSGRRGVDLETYIHSDTLRVRRAIGFTLGIDKWQVSAKGLRERDEIVRESGDRRQISFRGMRGYASKSRGVKSRLAVDLNAAMDAFSATPEATADEFDYGLHLSIESVENKLAGSEIGPYVDRAILWRAVARGELSEQIQELSRAIADKKHVEINCQLVFNDDAFRWVLQRLADDDADRIFGMALGAAMPWSRKQAEVRQNVALREMIYGPLWVAYLSSSTMNADQLAEMARDHLIDQHYRKLANLERFGQSQSAGAVARLHPNLRDDWHRFRDGGSRLNDAIERKQSYREIRRSYRAMNDLWASSFTLRALGVYLVELARRGNSTVKAGVERVMTIRYKSGTKEQVIHLSVS